MFSISLELFMDIQTQYKYQIVPFFIKRCGGCTSGTELICGRTSTRKIIVPAVISDYTAECVSPAPVTVITVYPKNRHITLKSVKQA